MSAACLIISQIRFELHDLLLAPFLVFTVTYVAYQVISLPVNFTGRGFDLAAHQARVGAWRPVAYPSVDIYLPICGEPIEVLRNTWSAVFELIAGYPGPAQAYVLDDGPSDEARSVCESYGFCYVRRPDARAYKKSGNLRHAFARTTGEYLVILDADFAPRRDFLVETLPYMDDPVIGIVQTPQYFRDSAGQSWIENAAGAIQEVFYRSIQVARDRFGQAICVGTSAIYRRAALEPYGGPTLIPYAEDVHTGLDVRRSGWSVVYLPIVLTAGICPDNLDAFVRQQYRWCTGNAGIVFSRRMWAVRMTVPARLTYISGFFYYAYTGLLTFFGPIIPIIMLAFLPGQIRLRNFIVLAPAMIAGFVLYPLWHRSKYGPSVWPLGIAPGVGARVLHLGQRPRQDDELAPVPDAGQRTATVPGVRHRVERRHGAVVGIPGRLANGDPGHGAVRRPGVLRRPEPRRREPRHLSRGQGGMRSNMVVLAALIAAAVALTFTGARFIFVPSPPSSSHASLPPSPISYSACSRAGRRRTMARSLSSRARPGGRRTWSPTTAAGRSRSRSPSRGQMFSHRIIPCVQIDPTYASVSGVAAGAYDGYLRQYADSVRDFGHAVVIGFGHEMNAPWYSWGYGHVRPSVFVAAWRHIVTLFRDQGADNVTWLWTLNQDRRGTGPVEQWWPGARYVSWVGIDGYYFRPSDTFSSAFGRTIDEVRAFTRKPVLLSETGVAPGAGQFAQISNLFDGMHREETLGLIWFDKSQHGSIYRQNWRIEDNEAAQAAFRLGIAPLTLVRP